MANVRHLPKETIKECHYIPANNMFADWVIGGKPACLKTLGTKTKRLEKAVDSGECPICAKSFLDWWERSCLLVIVALEDGKKVSDNYPPWDGGPCHLAGQGG